MFTKSLSMSSSRRANQNQCHRQSRQCSSSSNSIISAVLSFIFHLCWSKVPFGIATLFIFHVVLSSTRSVMLFVDGATATRITTTTTTSSLAKPLSIGIRSAIARQRGPFGSSSSSSNYQVLNNRNSNRGDTQRRTVTVRSKEHELNDHLSGKEKTENKNRLAIQRGGGVGNVVSVPSPPSRRLHFWEAMICGAISRAAAQTIMHPANTMKTMLQSSRRGSSTSATTEPVVTVVSFLTQWKYTQQLTRGAGAQLLLSIPHGAVNFAVLELVRRRMNSLVSMSRYADIIHRNFGPGMDFLSSAISTVCCSVVSTPQMMICDNIMAGTYPNLMTAVRNLGKERGLAGFYTGWWPGLAGKIPSYGLTWTLFEQIKRVRSKMFHERPAKDIENSIMGCLASATTVCIMIPMDTVKTRLVTQMNYPDLIPYKGILDCFQRVWKEEGIGAFYRGLTPRLFSVVPMIGIQFGVYEFMKKFMVARDEPAQVRASKAQLKKMADEAERERSGRLQEMAMEVAADDDQPFPAPYPQK